MGQFKTELIHLGSPWRVLGDVERHPWVGRLVTNQRLHSAHYHLHLQPADCEATHQPNQTKPNQTKSPLKPSSIQAEP